MSEPPARHPDGGLEMSGRFRSTATRSICSSGWGTPVGFGIAAAAHGSLLAARCWPISKARSGYWAGSPGTELSADVLALDRVARITASARKRPETADFVRFAAMSGRSSLPGPTGVASWGRKIAEGCAVDGMRAGWLAPRRVRALPRVAGQISRKASAAGKDQDDSWSVFLVGSATEVRHQLVRAGVVAQRLRLAATEHGLLSCVCTEPFDTLGVRGSLFGLGGVPGFPQLVVIVGEHQKVPAQKGNPS